MHIDMIVKKIGGNWKLDGAKAFGDKTTTLKKEVTKPLKFKSTKSITINESEILDNNSEACKVKGLYINDDSINQRLIPFEGDKSFIMTKKYVYETDEGNLIKKWGIKNTFNDHVDIYVIYTYEGTKFYPDGFTVDEPSGEYFQYDVEWLPANKVFINKEYINE